MTLDPPQPQPSSSTPRLAAIDLACRRGTRLLFHDLGFEVQRGQIVWLRGQNGRGKTSLLRLAAGLSTPERGRVLCDGVPPRRLAQPGAQPVFIGHANALKEDLTVTEALAFLLRIHGLRHEQATVHGALERVGLNGRRQAPVRTLSQGQRRRVALARLAVDDRASLWILDEPFDALDIDGVQRLNTLLTEHVRRGGSVLLTSHLLLDAALQAQQIDLDRYC